MGCSFCMLLLTTYSHCKDIQDEYYDAVSAYSITEVRKRATEGLQKATEYEMSDDVSDTNHRFSGTKSGSAYMDYNAMEVESADFNMDFWITQMGP